MKKLINIEKNEKNNKKKVYTLTPYFFFFLGLDIFGLYNTWKYKINSDFKSSSREEICENILSNLKDSTSYLNDFDGDDFDL
jgi:hypothetical protein